MMRAFREIRQSHLHGYIQPFRTSLTSACTRTSTSKLALAGEAER